MVIAVDEIMKYVRIIYFYGLNYINNFSGTSGTVEYSVVLPVCTVDHL